MDSGNILMDSAH